MRFHTLVSAFSSVQSENFFCTWREWSLLLASSKACLFTRLLAIGQVAVGLEVVESAVCRWCCVFSGMSWRFKKAALLINKEISLMAGSEVFVRQQRRLSFALVFASGIDGMFSDAGWVSKTWVEFLGRFSHFRTILVVWVSRWTRHDLYV